MTVQNGATIFTISIILTTRWQKTLVLSPVLYTVLLKDILEHELHILSGPFGQLRVVRGKNEFEFFLPTFEGDFLTFHGQLSPKTEVRTLFHKFCTANILFWEDLGVVCFKLKNQSFL